MKNLSVLDKKRNAVNTNGLLDFLKDAKRLSEEMDVGQRKGTITLTPKHPKLPAFFWLLCDSHLGSVKVDYDAFAAQYRLVRDTPNFYALCNGDEVDNFLVGMGGTSAGVYEDAISPEQQALLMRGLFKTLDEEGKCAAFSFGNHNQWIKSAGLKFENTWLRDFTCPLLNCGGLLTVHYGDQTYRIALTHRYFGGSKLNITNPAKRFLDMEYSQADVSFIGHYHAKSVEQFIRGGDEKIAIVGGCFKTDDEWSAQAGISINNAGLGGITLALMPDRKRIIPFFTLEDAVDYFKNMLK
jgi:hypothetical protein